MDRCRALLNELGGRTRADAAPGMSNLPCPADQNKIVVSAIQSDPLHQDGFALYCGDAKRVGEGFAVALRAMGIEVDASSEDIALANVKQTTED